MLQNDLRKNENEKSSYSREHGQISDRIIEIRNTWVNVLSSIFNCISYNSVIYVDVYFRAHIDYERERLELDEVINTLERDLEEFRAQLKMTEHERKQYRQAAGHCQHQLYKTRSVSI